MKTLTAIIITGPDYTSKLVYPTDYFTVLETLTQMYLDKPGDYQDHVDRAAEVISEGLCFERVAIDTKVKLGLGIEYV